MAVYTEVSDDELAAFVASYDLGALLSYKGIAEGVENTNYLVHTEKGPFFLTLYEKRVAPDDLPFFLGLMEHLGKAGINCPTPGSRRARPHAAEAGGPAGGAGDVPGRRVDQTTAAQPLPGGGRGARKAASGRPRLRADPRQRAGACRLASALRALPVARRRDRAGPRGDHRAGARRPGGAAGRTACRKASFTPICSPTTCSFWATSSPR